MMCIDLSTAETPDRLRVGGVVRKEARLLLPGSETWRRTA